MPDIAPKTGLTAARLALIAGMIAAGVWWILRTPYDAEAVWRAIPAKATFYTHHYRASERVTAYARNPLSMTLLRSAGFEPAGLSAILEEREAARWAHNLFGRETVTAYVPDLGAAGPAWVFASWIGNRAQRLRWTAAWRGIPGLSAERLPGNITFWRLEHAPLDDGAHLAFTLADGLLLGSVSADPAAVRHLFATWSRLPGYPSLAQTLLPDPAGSRPAAGLIAPDRAVYAPDGADSIARGGSGIVAAFETLAADSAAVNLTGNFAFPSAGRKAEAPQLANLAVILGEYPVFFAYVAPEVSADILSRAGLPAWTRLLEPALERTSPEAQTNGPENAAAGIHPFFIAVLDNRSTLSAGNLPAGPASVRIPHLTVPALVAGLHTGPETGDPSVLTDILDRLNRTYGLGLIPRRGAGETVTVIEDTRSGRSFYDFLPLNEKVGARRFDGWLLFGQAGVLGALPHAAAGEPQTTGRRPPDTDTAQLYIRTDFDRFGRLAGRLLDACIAAWPLRDANDFADLRRLANARAWVEGLRPLGESYLWIESGEPRLSLRFRSGNPGVPPDAPR